MPEIEVILKDLLLWLQSVDWLEIAKVSWRPIVSGLAGLIGGWVAAQWRAHRERRKRGSGFWYDRVTIARYYKLADGKWFKDSMGGIFLGEIVKSELNASVVINQTGPNGMNREHPLYTHVKDILFQESSDRLGSRGVKGIHTLTFRKNDRGDGSRGNLEVVLMPSQLWRELQTCEELPGVVVGRNHLEAMQATARNSPPDWFIAAQPENAQEFLGEGLGIMKAETAPS